MDRAPGWRCYPKAGGGEQGDPSACTLPQPGSTRLLILPSLAKTQGKSLSDTPFPSNKHSAWALGTNSQLA